MPAPDRRVLLVVNARTRDSATHSLPDAKGRPQRRADFTVIQERLDADVLDWDDVDGSGLGRLVRKVAGTYVALAVLAFRRRRVVSAYWCDVENEAIVLALLLKVVRKRVPLVCMGVYPAKPVKIPAWRWVRVQTHLDIVQPLTTHQGDLLIERGRVDPGQVWPLPYAVDAVFWDPALATPRVGPRPYIFACGLQHRDYPTLVEASLGLDADLLIAAGSLWSRSGDSLAGSGELPGHVTVEAMDYLTLRDAYAGAAIVVAPTVESDFAPGITSILEAMAMGRPVIATRAAGNGDYVTDRRSVLRGAVPRSTAGGFGPRFASAATQGPTGFYVAPGDVGALHQGLRKLLADPELAHELGERGRQVVHEVHTVEGYAQRVDEAVTAAVKRVEDGG